VGQRKLWGIVGLTKRYPAQCVNTACAQALEQGVYSYKRVQALSERLFADAMAAMDDGANHEVSHEANHGVNHGVNSGLQAQTGATALGAKLAQQHALIRQADEYADLFTHAAMAASAAVAKAMDSNTGGKP